MDMPTKDEVNSALRHVYSVIGTAAAIGVAIGLNPDEVMTAVKAVHAIGDGLAEVVGGIGILIPLISGFYAAWSASPFSRLLSFSKNSDLHTLVAKAGTPLAALVDQIPTRNMQTSADVAVVPVAPQQQQGVGGSAGVGGGV
jgi:hypothetical protein